MGKYIETPERFNKAEQIIKLHGAEEVPAIEALTYIFNPDIAVIVVVENMLFDAALFAHDPHELILTQDPSDRRPKRYLLMDRVKAAELTNLCDALSPSYGLPRHAPNYARCVNDRGHDGSHFTFDENGTRWTWENVEAEQGAGSGS